MRIEHYPMKLMENYVLERDGEIDPFVVSNNTFVESDNLLLFERQTVSASERFIYKQMWARFEKNEVRIIDSQIIKSDSIIRLGC